MSTDPTGGSAAALAEQLTELTARNRDLEAELAVYKFEVATLQLQLDVMSNLDPITGLLNLHGTIELIDAAIHRRERKREPFAVMTVRCPSVLEVREKQGSDSYHGALRHAGSLITAALRQLDRVGRLDQSTFLAVLPDMTVAGVAALTDRLERMLLSVPFDYGEETIRLLPEISIVLSQADGTVESPRLLDLLYEASDQSEFGRPMVSVATDAESIDLTSPPQDQATTGGDRTASATHHVPAE